MARYLPGSRWHLHPSYFRGFADGVASPRILDDTVLTSTLPKTPTSTTAGRHPALQLGSIPTVHPEPARACKASQSFLQPSLPPDTLLRCYAHPPWLLKLLPSSPTGTSTSRSRVTPTRSLHHPLPMLLLWSSTALLAMFVLVKDLSSLASEPPAYPASPVSWA
jgi:hypothetical protein